MCIGRTITAISIAVAINLTIGEQEVEVQAFSRHFSVLERANKLAKNEIANFHANK